jgi:hypothetical protein
MRRSGDIAIFSERGYLAKQLYVIFTTPAWHRSGA